LVVSGYSLLLHFIFRDIVVSLAPLPFSYPLIFFSLEDIPSSVTAMLAFRQHPAVHSNLALSSKVGFLPYPQTMSAEMLSKYSHYTVSLKQCHSLFFFFGGVVFHIYIQAVGRPRRSWLDNIRMGVVEVGWGDVGWIGLAYDRDKWRALMNSVLNLRVT
jgi:hypothetical protein